MQIVETLLQPFDQIVETLMQPFDTSSTTGTALHNMFQECSSPKAGSYVTTCSCDWNTKLENGAWYVAATCRLGFNPYPEVSGMLVMQAAYRP